MEQVLSPKDFVPRESVEKREYWMYFPFFTLHNWGKRFGESRSLHCAVLPRAIPHNSARAGVEGFFLSRKFGKQRNTWCISCFPNCADGGKDPPSGRRRNCTVLPIIFRACCKARPAVFRGVETGDSLKQAGTCRVGYWRADPSTRSAPSG